MRKSKLLAGVYGVYAAYDKVAKHYKGLYFANTDEEFIRLYLPTVIIDTPLRDVTIFKIGLFNDVTGEIKQCAKKRISTDCYLFPHSKLSPVGENVTPEEIEKVIIETKQEIIANNSNENKEEK